MKLRSIAGLFVLFCSIAFTTVANPFASDPRDEMKRSTPVSVGEQAPDFKLEDIDGNQVTLSATHGKVPTVLVFYRGYWCPFCAHQLSELRSLLRANEQVRVLAVSVDDQEKTKQLIEKIAADGKGAVNFTLLSDPRH
jgi:peroxiredoxin